MIESIITWIKSKNLEFSKIGISSAGQIDVKNGIVSYATDNIKGYTGFHLKHTFENIFQVPTIIENDVNACAIGECIYGSGKDFNDFLCLTIGTGIGGAIVLNKNIYYGSNYFAGEFGHILTHPNGIKCTCGQKGCYEQYASTNALINLVYENTGNKLDGITIFNNLEKYKPIIDNWILEICHGLVSLIYIFNPSAIVIGGGIMEQSYVINKINEMLQSMIMQNYKSTKILNATLGNNASLMGAYYLTQV